MMRRAAVVCSMALFCAVALAQPRPPAPAGDPRDGAFASFVLDAARAIESAARRQPISERWLGPDPADDLRGTSPSIASVLAPLGSWRVVATALEVEAIAPNLYVRSNVLVFPDGRVRWWRIDSRDGASLSAQRGLPAPLAGTVERMIAALRTCTLPVANASDLAGLPDVLVRDANAAANLRSVCSAVAAQPGATFAPRFDDISAIANGNGRWVALRSSFDVDGGRISLAPVRPRE